MIGKKLAHYEIAAKLGEGGMGEVDLAKDSKLQREVALKLLPPELATNDERMARFRREATVLAALNHADWNALPSLSPDEKSSPLRPRRSGSKSTFVISKERGRPIRCPRTAAATACGRRTAAGSTITTTRATR